MTSRERILERIGSAVSGGAQSDAERRSAAIRRIGKAPPGLVPARALGKAPGELRQMLRTYLERQAATVIDVPGAEQVPAAIKAYLEGFGIPLIVRTGQDPDIANLPWKNEPALRRVEGPAASGDAVGLSRAVAGIAETGTVVLLSGPKNPVTVGLLPETHIVLLAADAIVGPYEAAWQQLRESAAGGWPRTINLVAGPSRTADIGGILVTGAHGPRRLCVIVMD